MSVPTDGAEARFLFRRRRRISEAELELNNLMRLLWEQHTAWTRMTINASVFGTPDQQAVTARLLRNPTNFARALEPLYGRAIASEFERLLRDHLVIAAELVTAAKAGDTQAAADAEVRWYQNADQIAALLGRINPFWSEAEWRAMLHEHLRNVKGEAVALLNSQFELSTRVYDEAERQALMMADELTRGIVRQFPRKF
ncbi:MAG: acetylglutamate kinase [Bacillota bacterium]